MAHIEVVVIGGSAGAIEALTTIIRQLPADLSAALLIVIHTRAEGTSYLDRVLARDSVLPVSFAGDNMAIEPAHVYVAPPGSHLTVHDHSLCLVHGPKENGFRPAVDPLFRSAARQYGSRAMGIILSGALDDGTYGLKIIKDGGGMAVVQNPAEATHPEMVLSAMRFVDVDHVMNAAGIANLIVDSSTTGAPAKGEQHMARQREPDPQNRADQTDVEEMERDFGPPSGLTCPDCGGALWELQNGDLTRYRCHVGHQFTTEGLDAGQSEQVESALWTAVRVLEEHAELRKRLSERADDAGLSQVATGFSDSAKETQRQARTIRELLFGKTPLPAAQSEPTMQQPRERRKAKKAKTARRTPTRR
jgi:two-component system chemotaxis response regulator CheB